MRTRPSLSATFRERCRVQKEHWQERTVSSSARRRVSISACKFPQWQLEWKTGMVLSGALAARRRFRLGRLLRASHDGVRAERLRSQAHLPGDLRLFPGGVADRALPAGRLGAPDPPRRPTVPRTDSISFSES